jgi:hypothetical protein
MLHLDLSANEIRVIGCLMEKSKVTPDQYPLTLNALTNACNQKSSRSPVMSLTQGVVQHTIRELETKHLVSIEENFTRGVEKYTQRFCNTRFSELQLDSAQFSVVCLLLLRGPQTPGELRAHSGRLHSFADNSAVVNTLNQLMQREGEPLVVQLPRIAGRKDSEYMHLFAGPVDIEEYAVKAQSEKGSEPSKRSNMSELELRVSQLEEEMLELRKLLSD